MFTILFLPLSSIFLVYLRKYFITGHMAYFFSLRIEYCYTALDFFYWSKKYKENKIINSVIYIIMFP